MERSIASVSGMSINFRLQLGPKGSGQTAVLRFENQQTGRQRSKMTLVVPRSPLIYCWPLLYGGRLKALAQVPQRRLIRSVFGCLRAFLLL